MKFHVVEHTCGGYSVQTQPNGGGVLLNVDHPKTKEGAQQACDAANKAIEIYQHAQKHGKDV